MIEGVLFLGVCLIAIIIFWAPAFFAMDQAIQMDEQEDQQTLSSKQEKKH